MRPEELECIFDSFIASRRRYADVPDAVLQCAENHAVPAQGHCGMQDADVQLPDFGIHNVSSGPLVSQGAQVQDNVYAVIDAEVQAQVQAPDQQDRNIAVGRQLAELANQHEMNLPDRSIVKFEKSCIVVAPEEQIISVTIRRSSASANTDTNVTWWTCDRTAISGTHYIQCSGEIVFEMGVLEKTIQIKILHSSGDDLRFNVKMAVAGGVFDPRPMTITLKNLDNLYEAELEVVSNLFSLPSFSVAEVRNVLSDCLNPRTFYMGLTHACSAAESIHLEFALALDLGQMCLMRGQGYITCLSRSTILGALRNYFRADDIQF